MNQDQFNQILAYLDLEDLAQETGIIPVYKETKTLLDHFITQDKNLLIVKTKIAKLTPTDIPVLIIGQSGTGKELLARSLHGSRKGPFVPVNCAGIPSELLEAEFFGAAAGAYTDCKKDRKGLLEEAENGTLFLDEIGDMPLLLQSKMLRFLQDKDYRRLGDTNAKRSTARIISATNANINLLIGRNKFRSDLYYRLKGIRLYIKPLKDRPSDVDLIVHSLIKDPILAAKIIELSKLKLMSEEEFIAGNVRELINFTREFELLGE